MAEMHLPMLPRLYILYLAKPPRSLINKTKTSRRDAGIAAVKIKKKDYLSQRHEGTKKF